MNSLKILKAFKCVFSRAKRNPKFKIYCYCHDDKIAFRQLKVKDDKKGFIASILYKEYETLEYIGKKFFFFKKFKSVKKSYAEVCVYNIDKDMKFECTFENIYKYGIKEYIEKEIEVFKEKELKEKNKALDELIKEI